MNEERDKVLIELLEEERMVTRMYRKLHRGDRAEIVKLEKENFDLRYQLMEARREAE